ncbi:MAG: hypothetical protein JNN20_13230 [Betaproteobacteria bacterium]|nr:hypothetical protein [Betaproteobacteria bacterium]
MDTALVFVKTEKGHEEIDRRTYHLNFKHRTALIVVDGVSNAELLLPKIPGDGVSLLEELWRDGFIAPSTGEPANVVSKASPPAAETESATFDLEAMKRSAVKAIEAILGPNGESLAIAIERAKTRADFVAQAEKTREIVRAMGGQRRADEFWSKTGL